MAITQAICNSFKDDLLSGLQDLSNDTLKIALYTSSATLDASTTAYTTDNEVTGAGYVAGGINLENISVTLDGSTAIFDCDDPVFGPSVSFTTAGALIYNSTQLDAAIAVLDFGGDFTVSAGTFTVNIPAATTSTALIRLA